MDQFSYEKGLLKAEAPRKLSPKESSNEQSILKNPGNQIIVIEEEDIQEESGRKNVSMGERKSVEKDSNGEEWMV